MGNFKKIFLALAFLLGSTSHADYATGKRIIAADIIQGTASVENYIKDSPPKAGLARGWSCYNDGGVDKPIDGTGGTASGITWTATSTTPLKGPGSYVFTKSGAALKLGMGCSYDFSINAQDKAKVLDISLDYLVGSGTFAAGTSTTDSDVIVYIYDKTNGKLIEPSSRKLLSNSATISDQYRASFQTASDSTDYRLIFHVATLVAYDFTLKFGDISVSRSKYVYSTPITDGKVYLPVFNGFGTPTSVECFWKQVGDEVEMDLSFTTGTTTGVEARIGLPPGYVTAGSPKIITAKIAGQGVFSAASTNQYVLLAEPGVPYLVVAIQGTANAGLTKLVAANAYFGSGQRVSFKAKVPVQGLSSSVQMSDSADTRVVVMRATNVSGQAVASTGSGVTLTGWTVENDTHGSFNAATGLYTIPTSGFYRVSALVTPITTSYTVGTTLHHTLYLAGTRSETITRVAVQGTVNAYLVMQGSVLVYFNAGATTGLKWANSSGTDSSLLANGNNNWMTIEKISGPQAIAATETIAAGYGSSAGQSITGGNTLAFATKDFDTHGAFNTSTNTFTAPATGLYRIYARIYWGVSIGAGTNYYLSAKKNGTVIKNLTDDTSSAVAGTTASGSALVGLVAGDTITFEGGQNSGSGKTLSADAKYNYFTIERVK